jgi:hypothetical protein
MWVTVAAVAGALVAPASAAAADHVSLFVSPSALGGGWKLSASVPAREFTGGEIVGVTLRRTGRATESHDLRGNARSASTVAFDGRRGTWRVAGQVGSSLTVRMTIVPSGPARPVGQSFGCRGGFVQAPVTLRGRFVVRTGTRFFGTIRRSRLAGTIVFNDGGGLDCSALPTVCSPSTQLRGLHGLHGLTASPDDGGYLAVSFRQAVRGGAWYHRVELTGFDPLAFAGSTVTVRAPAGLPLAGAGTFTPGRTVESVVGGCGVATTTGTFAGLFRAHFTGWPSRTLVFGASDAATFATSGARSSG